MHLRFRSPVGFALTGNVAQAKVGASTLAIHKVVGAGTPEVRSIQPGDCWKGDRGKCDAARFPIGEYRVQIPGATPQGLHVIDVAGGDALTIAALPQTTTHLRRGTQDAYVSSKAGYAVAPSAGAIHVVLAETANQKISVSKDGAKCKVDVGDGGSREAGPIVVVVDASCTAVDDVRTGPAAPDFAGGSASLIPIPGPPQRSKTRGGCCDGGASGASVAMGLVVLAGVRRRRRP